MRLLVFSVGVRVGFGFGFGLTFTAVAAGPWRQQRLAGTCPALTDCISTTIAELLVQL